VHALTCSLLYGILLLCILCLTNVLYFTNQVEHVSECPVIQADQEKELIKVLHGQQLGDAVCWSPHIFCILSNFIASLIVDV